MGVSFRSSSRPHYSIPNQKYSPDLTSLKMILTVVSSIVVAMRAINYSLAAADSLSYCLVTVGLFMGEVSEFMFVTRDILQYENI